MQSNLETKHEGLETILDFIRWGASRMNEAGVFFGHGTADAFHESTALVLSALHLPHASEPEYCQSRLSVDERFRVMELIERRIGERLPAAYLSNEAWFAGHPFYVDQRVLVPRSPIAELVERRFQPWVDRPAGVGRILDLCTGSGCIGIACAHAFPRAQVDLADLSESALEVAELNVIEHGLTDRVAVICSDLFAELQGQRYDLIVSNPPYVSLEEMEQLPDEYLHEPEFGLAAGETGLDLVSRILAAAHPFLASDGVLVVEVGATWPRVVETWPRVPFQWQHFKRGGEGVFLLTAQELDENWNGT